MNFIQLLLIGAISLASAKDSNANQTISNITLASNTTLPNNNAL
jgi:hypothetical protein